MRGLTVRIRLATLSACLCAAYSAPAGAWGDSTEAERALLPYYCRATLVYPDTPERQAMMRQMQQTYGREFESMHHYCQSLVWLAREERKYPRHSNFNISMALQGMNSLLASGPGFAPRAEIMATIARTELKYRTPAEAAATATALIKEVPTNADGYLILAEALLKEKRRDEALKVLELGAANVSDKERFEKRKSILKLN